MRHDYTTICNLCVNFCCLQLNPKLNFIGFNNLWPNDITDLTHKYKFNLNVNSATEKQLRLRKMFVQQQFQPSLPPTHTHTLQYALIYACYHPPLPPAVLVKDALPIQLPLSGRAGEWENGWCGVTPHCKRPLGHPIDTLTTPPPSIHPQLPQLRPLDRHLTGCRVILSPAGGW